MQSGTYRFTYVDGAYSVWPLGAVPAGTKPWLTAVLVYDGAAAVFEGEVIDKGSAVLWLVDEGYSGTREEAEAKADLDRAGRDLVLESQQTITLIGIDHYSAYADNVGEVVIDISVAG